MPRSLPGAVAGRSGYTPPVICKRCAAAEAVEVCLFCGHGFCPLHRGERGGLAACVPCLEAEAARRAAPRAAAAAAAPPQRAREAPDPAPREAPPPPTLLPEPPGWTPVLWGLVAALPAGGYLYWLVGALAARGHELPPWAAPAGAAAAAGFAFLGVWAIVKSR